MNRRKPFLVVLAFVGAAVLSAAANPDVAAADLTSWFNQGLPLLRWGSFDVPLFSHIAGVDIMNVARWTAVSAANNAFFIGNNVWFMTLVLVGWGTGVDPLEQAGFYLDSVLSTLLSSIFMTPRGGSLSIVGWLIVAAFLAAILVNLAMHRGRGLFKRVVAVSLVSAVLFTMGSQLMSTVPERDADGQYSAAPGTPGWVVQMISGAVDVIGQAPTESILTASGTGVNTVDDASILGCEAYVDGMQTLFFDEGGNQSAAAISTMWQQQFLGTYIGVQFGDQSQLGEQVYCRMLDSQGSISPYESHQIDQALIAGGGEVEPGWEPEGRSASDVRDLTRYADYGSAGRWAATMTAWAVCNYVEDGDGGYRWEADPLFEDFAGQSLDELTEDCSWLDAHLNEDPQPTAPDAFRVDSGSAIEDRVNPITDADRREQIFDYLTALTGREANWSAAGAFAVSAIVTTTPLNLFEIFVLLAKVMSLVFCVGIFLALIAALYRERPVADAIMPSVLSVTGWTIIAYASGLLLSLITLFTMLIGSLATAGGIARSSFMGLVVAALAPWLAIVAIHLLFTKIFRLPSPVSIRGMAAWSKGAPLMAGAALGAVGSMLGSGLMSRLAGSAGSTAANAAKQGGRRLANAAVKKATGGKLDIAGARMDGGDRPGTRGDKLGKLAATGGTMASGLLGKQDRATALAAAKAEEQAIAKAKAKAEQETAQVAKARQRALRRKTVAEQGRGALMRQDLGAVFGKARNVVGSGTAAIRTSMAKATEPIKRDWADAAARAQALRDAMDDGGQADVGDVAERYFGQMAQRATSKDARRSFGRMATSLPVRATAATALTVLSAGVAAPAAAALFVPEMKKAAAARAARQQARLQREETMLQSYMSRHKPPDKARGPEKRQGDDDRGY